MEDDFELIDRVFSRLAHRAEKRGDRLLTEEELAVVLTWHASGIMENGGFQYFFEQGLDAAAVAAAYERIGCSKCAEVIRLGLSLFPDSIMREDSIGRAAFVLQNQHIFYQASCLFWDADRETEPQLAEFIRANLSEMPSAALQE